MQHNATQYEYKLSISIQVLRRIFYHFNAINSIRLFYSTINIMYVIYNLISIHTELSILTKKKKLTQIT